jgi:hypothetical protein
MSSAVQKAIEAAITAIHPGGPRQTRAVIGGLSIKARIGRLQLQESVMLDITSIKKVTSIDRTFNIESNELMMFVGPGSGIR